MGSETDECKKLLEKWAIPRLAGSKGSYKIVELLKEDFQDFNFEFNEQKFPVFHSDTSFQNSLRFLFMAILFAIFLILFWFLFWWSLIVVIPLFVFAIRLKKSPKRAKICKTRLEKEESGEEWAFTQSNLIYRLKSKRKCKCSILLMAHHDSKSQSFPTESRAYIAFLLSVIFLSIAMLYILCVSLEIFGITQHLWLRPVTFILGWFIVIIFIVFALNRISNNSPGALDNASGMYVLWKTAQLIHNTPLENCELWIVLTGSEEIGQIGAADFLNEHRESLDPESSYLLNYEMVGLKDFPLEVLESYYIPFKRKISPELYPIAVKSAEKLGIRLKGWYLPIGAHTDAFLFRKEGYKAINFVTKRAGRYTHLPKDKIELIDAKLLIDQAKLNVEIIQNIDRMFI